MRGNPAGGLIVTGYAVPVHAGILLNGFKQLRPFLFYDGGRSKKIEIDAEVQNPSLGNVQPLHVGFGDPAVYIF